MYGRIGPIEFLIPLLMLGFFIYCYWRIWSKAGFNGAWSLLLLVPLANLGSIIYLAFAKWPVHDRSSELGKTFD